MNPNLMDMLNIWKGIALSTLMPSILTYLLACGVLEARRPIWILLVYTCLKAFYIENITPWLLTQSEAYSLLPAVNAFLFPLLACAVIMYFFKGDIIKSVLTNLVCEAASILIYAVCQKLAFRIFPGQSLLIIPIFLVISVLFYRAVRPLLFKCRAIEIRHKKIAGVIMGAGLLSSAVSYVKNEGAAIWKYAFESAIVSIGWLTAVSLMTWMVLTWTRHRAELEGEYLKLQQSLIETNYRILKQTRTRDYDRMLHELDDQMEELARMDHSDHKTERIRNYITYLKQEYASVRSGIYCDDPLVDSVLCYQADRLEKAGIAFSCHCHDYARGEIEENDLAQLLLRMIEMAVQDLGLPMAAGKSSAVSSGISRTDERSGKIGKGKSASRQKRASERETEPEKKSAFERKNTSEQESTSGQKNASEQKSASEARDMKAAAELWLASVKGQLVIQLSWKRTDLCENTLPEEMVETVTAEKTERVEKTERAESVIRAVRMAGAVKTTKMTRMSRTAKTQWMKSYLKKYQGMMRQEKNDEETEIMIGLAMENICPETLPWM